MTEVPSDIGTVIPGGYRLSRLVGEDALGHHYAARDPGSHKQVSVLLVRASVLEGSLGAKFDAACAAMEGLSHPHLLPLLAWGRLEGRGYRVTPWTGSRTIATALADPILVSTGVGWGRELAEALATAHGAGLLHRGLSPSAVQLVRRQVPPDQVRLDGFGLATLLLEGDTSSTAGLGRRLGGAAWTSPEQALGKEVDARSDLYALGAVLFQCLTGRALFTGPSMKVLAAHVNEQPQPPSSVTTGIPHWLDEIVLSLLEKDPANRPASALEVAERLRDGSALLVDGAAHPERVTANVAPVRLPSADIRGAASRRTPPSKLRGRVQVQQLPSGPVVGLALGVFVFGAASVVLVWWIAGGFP